jgi:hypothetical protein
MTNPRLMEVLTPRNRETVRERKDAPVAVTDDQGHDEVNKISPDIPWRPTISLLPLSTDVLYGGLECRLGVVWCYTCTNDRSLSACPLVCLAWQGSNEDLRCSERCRV